MNTLNSPNSMRRFWHGNLVDARVDTRDSLGPLVVRIVALRRRRIPLLELGFPYGSNPTMCHFPRRIFRKPKNVCAWAGNLVFRGFRKYAQGRVLGVCLQLAGARSAGVQGSSAEQKLTSKERLVPPKRAVICKLCERKPSSGNCAKVLDQLSNRDSRSKSCTWQAA